MFLGGLGAIVLLTLNVLAFSSTSAYAYQHPLDPIYIGDCYQTMSSCDVTGVLYENCTSRHTSRNCKQTNAKCHGCGNEPIIYDPVVGPIVYPGIGPEHPGEPMPWGGSNDSGAGQFHP